MNFVLADPRHRSSSSQAAPDTRKTSTFYKSNSPKHGINEYNFKLSSFSLYATGKLFRMGGLLVINIGKLQEIWLIFA